MRVIQITKLYFYFIPSKVATQKKEAMKLRLLIRTVFLNRRISNLRYSLTHQESLVFNNKNMEIQRF